jgi:hypothetical protein
MYFLSQNSLSLRFRLINFFFQIFLWHHQERVLLWTMTSPAPATTMSHWSLGHGALYSRTTARRMFTAVSIVQLTQREHSGNILAVSVHQHFGYGMHYMWNGSFGSRNFERRLCSYNSVQELCKDIFTPTLEGSCVCISVRDEFLAPDRLPLFELWCDKIDICRVLLPLYLCGWMRTYCGPQSEL